jgi:hypothetical protein
MEGVLNMAMTSRFTTVRAMHATIPSRTFVLSFAVKKCEIRIYKTIILPGVLYGCENMVSDSKRGT